LIDNEHRALQNHISLPDDAPDRPEMLPGNKILQEPIILWRHENRCCHARTVRGGRCKNSTNLLVITYKHMGKVYELTTCKEHDTDFFKPYPGLFRLQI